MRNLAMRVLAATAFVALTVSAYATPPVPRKSPEFTITEPSGKQVLLSSLRGKIVVMPFMFTTCPHCQREAQMLTTLQKEFAARGVVMIGTVFNDANAAMAAQFVKEFNVGFPVGYATRDQVVSYLGLSVLDRWVVPQVAILDKKGNIVAQTAATGTPELQDETYLRNFLDKLVKESSTTSKAAPAKTSAKAVAKSSVAKNN
ncbi:MAG TPA: TlpA disulfide reductase family protein [Candidatus Sulfopaludibacter sp.]|nr:TlpA disulfide reductase family protein [Candidatus Sulfopaludibacter sp.]